jgi:hypothetical protein
LSRETASPNSQKRPVHTSTRIVRFFPIGESQRTDRP